jgi:hypothetical protein
MLVQGYGATQAFSGFSLVYILLAGHFPYYSILDLSLIKASKYLFSLQGFSKGFYLKKLVSGAQYSGLLIYASAACLVDYSNFHLVDKVILF